MVWGCCAVNSLYVDLFENVLESSIISLEDGVLSAVRGRETEREREREREREGERERERELCLSTIEDKHLLSKHHMHVLASTQSIQ